MRFFLFFLILVFVKSVKCEQFLGTNSSLNDCFGRCHRLLKRTLSKINYSINEIDFLFKSNQKIKNLGDICWKFHDFYDCEKQCQKRPKRSITHLDLLTKTILKKCKFVDEEANNNIRCIHKYHSFLEVRCLSYMNEAVKLKKLVDETADEKNKKIKVQETCRFLHYHDMCLSNTVFYYCPNAKKLFNGFTLNDYFLSFVVPENDQDFPDTFLDYCQNFDFQRLTKNIYDTTSSVKIENMDDQMETTTIMPKETISTLNVKLLPEKKVENMSKTNEKKVFASEEDLEETPPNFFYSSARYETTTYNPVKIIKKEERRSTKYPVHPANYFWYPEPVTIEFISNQIDSSEKETKTVENQGFTLNPNQLLSTIFRIPNVFPTSVTVPDVHPSEADYWSQIVEVENDNVEGTEFDEKEMDFEVNWETKNLNQTTKKQIEKLENKQITNLKNETKQSIESPSLSVQNKSESSQSQETVLIKLLTGNNSSEIVESSLEQLMNVSVNSSESLHPIDDNKTTNLPVSTYSEPSLSKATTTLFKIPMIKGPLLSGTKIHVKRIRHFSELEKDSDNVEEEVIEEFEKPHIEIAKIPVPKVDARIVSTRKTGDIKTKSEDFWTSVIETEDQNVDPKTDSNLFEIVDQTISSMTAIKWFILLYSVLFVVAFLVLIYLVVSIIAKKCKKRGKYVLHE